jgi:hypothetical protein
MALHGAQNYQRFYIHTRKTNTTTRENSWFNHEYWRFNGIMSGNIMGYSKPTNISNLNHWSTSGEFIEFSQNSSGASYHLYENTSQGLSKWFLPKIKVTATEGVPNIFQTIRVNPFFEGRALAMQYVHWWLPFYMEYQLWSILYRVMIHQAWLLNHVKPIYIMMPRPEAAT